MFLIRLMHLKSLEFKYDLSDDKDLFKSIEKNEKKKNIISELKSDVINQIKNVTQEEKIKPEIDKEIKIEGKILINSFSQLLNICTEKKEIKLKYELEKNVNLVGFEKNRIEISFNDNLDKNFVKDLSLKLFEWTHQRWIITFSKKKGEISIRDKEKNKKNELIKNAKETKLYKSMIKKFPDANLIDVNPSKKKD